MKKIYLLFCFLLCPITHLSAMKNLALVGNNLVEKKLLENKLLETSLVKPNLAETSLAETSFVEANFSRNNLLKTEVVKPKLVKARLSKANLKSVKTIGKFSGHKLTDLEDYGQTCCSGCLGFFGLIYSNGFFGLVNGDMPKENGLFKEVASDESDDFGEFGESDDFGEFYKVNKFDWSKKSRELKNDLLDDDLLDDDLFCLKDPFEMVSPDIGQDPQYMFRESVDTNLILPNVLSRGTSVPVIKRRQIVFINDFDEDINLEIGRYTIEDFKLDKLNLSNFCLSKEFVIRSGCLLPIDICSDDKGYLPIVRYKGVSEKRYKFLSTCLNKEFINQRLILRLKKRVYRAGIPVKNSEYEKEDVFGQESKLDKKVLFKKNCISGIDYEMFIVDEDKEYNLWQQFVQDINKMYEKLNDTRELMRSIEREAIGHGKLSLRSKGKCVEIFNFLKIIRNFGCLYKNIFMGQEYKKDFSSFYSIIKEFEGFWQFLKEKKLVDFLVDEKLEIINKNKVLCISCDKYLKERDICKKSIDSEFCEEKNISQKNGEMVCENAEKSSCQRNGEVVSKNIDKFSFSDWLKRCSGLPLFVNASEAEILNHLGKKTILSNQEFFGAIEQMLKVVSQDENINDDKKWIFGGRTIFSKSDFEFKTGELLEESFDLNFKFFAQKIKIPKNSEKFTHSDVHGDIHSLNACLYDLIDKNILDDELKIKKENFYMVFTGDYIDRGFYSAEVIRLISQLKIINKDKVILLKGNHDVAKFSWDKNNFILSLAKKFEEDRSLVRIIMEKFFNTMPVALFIGVEKNLCDLAVKHVDYDLFFHGSIDPAFDPNLLLSSDFDCAFQVINIKDCYGFNDFRWLNSCSVIKEVMKVYDDFSRKYNNLKDILFFTIGDFCIDDNDSFFDNESGRCSLSKRVVDCYLKACEKKVSNFSRNIFSYKINNIFRGHQHNGEVFDSMIENNGIYGFWFINKDYEDSENSKKNGNKIEDVIWDGLIDSIKLDGRSKIWMLNVCPESIFGRCKGYNYDTYAIISFDNEGKLILKPVCVEVFC